MSDDDTHFGDSSTLLASVTALLLCAIVIGIWIHNFSFKWIHESGTSIALGFGFGMLVHHVIPDSPLANLDFSHDVFFEFFLPPIIFCAGYTLRKRNFFRNIRVIMLLGVVCTILQFVLLGAGAALFNAWGLANTDAAPNGLTPVECLVFASIMSATDSVAVLSLLKQESQPTLFGILSGEAMVNDAVAIVLFKSITNVSVRNDHLAITWGFVGNFIGEFLALFFGSIALGLLFGLVASAFFFWLRGPHKPHAAHEVAAVFFFGFTCYLSTEVFHMSGIIALFVCGIVMNHYMSHSLSEDGHHASFAFFKIVGFIAETFVFVALGFFLPHYIEIADGNFSWPFLVTMIGYILLTRAILVFAFAYFLGNLGKKHYQRVLMPQVVVLIYSGSIRGVIAFALSQEVHQEHSNLIVTITFGIVLLTTLVGGTFTKPLFNLINLQAAADKQLWPEDEPTSPVAAVPLSSPLDEALLGEAEPSRRVSRCRRFTEAFKRFDRRFVMPLVGGQNMLPRSQERFEDGDDADSDVGGEWNVQTRSFVQHSLIVPARETPTSHSASSLIGERSLHNDSDLDADDSSPDIYFSED
ncbi:MAG: hypothetical protein MHM6MM_001728 [Cercozoa sp. M6MM]